MKVKELITMDVCIDVYDNVCEELGIAFQGPLKLTPEGQEKFRDVLEYDWVLADEGYSAYVCAVVDVDGEEGVWQAKLRKAKEFFDSAAGLCAWDDYDRWFISK